MLESGAKKISSPKFYPGCLITRTTQISFFKKKPKPILTTVVAAALAKFGHRVARHGWSSLKKKEVCARLDLATTGWIWPSPGHS